MKTNPTRYTRRVVRGDIGYICLKSKEDIWNNWAYIRSHVYTVKQSAPSKSERGELFYPAVLENGPAVLKDGDSEWFRIYAIPHCNYKSCIETARKIMQHKGAVEALMALTDNRVEPGILTEFLLGLEKGNHCETAH